MVIPSPGTGADPGKSSRSGAFRGSINPEPIRHWPPRGGEGSVACPGGINPWLRRVPCASAPAGFRQGPAGRPRRFQTDFKSGKITVKPRLTAWPSACQSTMREGRTFRSSLRRWLHWRCRLSGRALPGAAVPSCRPKPPAAALAARSHDPPKALDCGGLHRFPITPEPRRLRLANPSGSSGFITFSAAWACGDGGAVVDRGPKAPPSP